MHIHLLVVQTLGSRSRLGQQNSINFILKALTNESENPVKMENRKIRDFGKAKEDTIDSISNDGSTTRTLKSKIMESNAPLDVTGTGTDTLSDCVAKLPDEQVADAAHGLKQHQQIDEQAEGGNQQSSGEPESAAAAAAAAAPADDDKGQVQEQPKQKGCDKCGKKFGLTGGFSCRCGGTFCAFHRYSDRHDCSFDYREMGATEIRRDNPLVVPEKLRKL
ncbi:AN1-type zinc finger protein 6 [Drosophila hydei]|uniref:AN1-type zinc finger protein 6 n=1 Tax=Drosophila hydei TaxID=7224 RepID=A0A6J1MC88_DROHY|nr:AN1-type zinc finger protein 6 [Drosophila hydei]